MSTGINPRVTVNPDVRFGKPTIRGMRIRVSDILDLLSAGECRDEILKNDPYLEDADIIAALSYAARASHHT